MEDLKVSVDGERDRWILNVRFMDHYAGEDNRYACKHQLYKFKEIHIEKELIEIECLKFYCRWQRYISFDEFQKFIEKHPLDISLRELYAVEFAGERVNPKFG